MSEDALGEELAPDANIWRMYVEESTEQDQELVDSQNKNLDLMLLFATLFSAILTAFLLEAKKLLEEDPAVTSAELLLLIAQSQHRLELGTPNTSLQSVGSTPFESSTTARYINGLWFTALALSLAAALVAMLAKEWLAGFISSTVRPPYDYALQRQAKHNGLVSWQALYIIAFLPTLLHLSLLLFALGLVLYLWNLDETIAILVGAVAGVTFFLYVATTILGALFESCPFVTSISTYIRRVYSAIFGERYLFRNRLGSLKLFHHGGIPNETLEALGWLAANSRDPAVSSSAYQAMAGFTGLSQLPIYDHHELDPASRVKLKPLTQEGVTQTSNSPNVDVNITFLHAICQQFTETIVHKHREVAACSGANLARYAAAMPTLAAHIEEFRDLKLTRGAKNARKYWPSHQNNFELAFTTIDQVWSNDLAALSADTYAILTASELKLTAAVTSLDTIDPFNTSATPEFIQPGATHLHHVVIQPLDYHVLETKVSSARYTRALARASVLLHCHHSGQVFMSVTALIHLLNSISQVISSELVVFSSDLEIKVNVIGGPTEHCPNANVLGDPNGIFRRLLKTWDSEKIPGTWSKVENAAAEAVSSFAHHFLKQWIGRNEIQGPQSRSRSSSYRIEFELPVSLGDEDDRAVFYRALENWPNNENVSETRRPPPELLSRLLLIATISISQAELSDGDAELPVLTLRALYRAAAMLSGQRHLYEVVTKHRALIERLIQLVENSSVYLQSSTTQSPIATYLIKILALPFQQRTLMSYFGLHLRTLATLLKIAPKTSSLLAEVKLLLDDTMQLLRDRPTGYTRTLLESDALFMAVLDLGQCENYLPLIEAMVGNMLRYVINVSLREEPVVCNVSGLCGLLASLHFMFRAVPSADVMDPKHPMKEMCDFLEQKVDPEVWDELILRLRTERGMLDDRVFEAMISLRLEPLSDCLVDILPREIAGVHVSPRILYTE